MRGHNLVVCIWSINTQAVQSMTLQARGEALVQAIGAAYDVVKARRGTYQKPWGLFIAPEYLFAKPSQYGSHVYGEQRHLEEGDKNLLLEWFKLLSASCDGMILIPGTVAWQKPAIRTTPKSKPENRTVKARESLSVHARDFQGGDINAHLSGPYGTTQALTTRSKQEKLESPADTLRFARNTAYVLYDGQLLLKYNKGADFHEVLTDDGTVHIPGCKSGMFSVKPEGGDLRPIKFGIEICLDHVNYVLERSIPNGELADIHLLISAYVAPRTVVTSVSMNGYIIHASSNFGYSGVYMNGHHFLNFAFGKQAAIPGYGYCQLGFYGIHVDLEPGVRMPPPLPAFPGQP